MSLIISALHAWPLTRPEAIKIQEDLRSRLVLDPIKKPVRFVAGADVAYSKQTKRLFAAVVVVDLDSMETIETVMGEGKENFPYIPGLLSFREIPVLLGALEKLSCTPDVFLCDGQGIAHPQGLGLASHLGLWLNLPTVGCAKSRLVGDYAPVPRWKDSFSDLYFQGNRVGVVLRTKEGVNPVFVSPGHRIDIPSSVQVVLKSCRGYRLPEPSRRAHILATGLRSEPGQGKLPEDRF